MAKRSRRGRREKAAKKPAVIPVTQPAEAPPSSAAIQQVTDFIADYYYIYSDVRTLLLVTVIMIGLIFGLSYFV